MKLDKFLIYVQSRVGEVKKEGFSLNVSVSSKKINEKSLRLLYFLLNAYDPLFFITIEGLPHCLMPDASEHIIYKNKGEKKYSYDNVCKKCCFMHQCPGWQKSFNIDRKKINPPKNIPGEVVIEVTTDCNLACNTCVVERGKKVNTGLNEIKKIIFECKTLGIRPVRFTGGEPFLNKDIGKMLKFCKENDFYVMLNTNATVITDSGLKLLKENVDNILISLQGFNEESDRILTNSNTDFGKKIAVIMKLRSKIPMVRIGTVISRTLINNLDNYSKLIKRLGIDNWELYRPIIKVDHNEEFNISGEDLKKVMQYLFILKKGGLRTKIANPVPFCITNNMNLSLATLLGAMADDGHSRIIWDAKGYFKPSYHINENLGKTIREAWNSPFIKKIKSLDYLPFKCRRCDYLKWCKGGSRAMAKLIKNDYFAQDPLLIS